MAVCRFTALWREVLLLALRDADAAAYIQTPDFETVAALAGLDPDAVRRAFYRGRIETDKRRRKPQQVAA